MRRLLLILLLLFIPLVASAHSPMVGVDAVGRVDQQGYATITGTISCEAGAFGHLDVALAQLFAKRVWIRGSGTTDILCTGEEQEFEVRVVGDTGLFKRGEADLSYRVRLDCDEHGCAQYEEGNAKVRLRR
jgi:hypothetical protein